MKISDGFEKTCVAIALLTLSIAIVVGSIKDALVDTRNQDRMKKMEERITKIELRYGEPILGDKNAR